MGVVKVERFPSLPTAFQDINLVCVLRMLVQKELSRLWPAILTEVAMKDDHFGGVIVQGGEGRVLF